MAIQISPEFKKALEEGTDRLDALNEKYSELATGKTTKAVKDMRNLLGAIEVTPLNQGEHVDNVTLVAPKAGDDKGGGLSPEEIKSIAQGTLLHNGLDDTLDILDTKYKVSLSTEELVELVGPDAYKDALKREGEEYRANSISFDQIAQLWNDFGRPPLGEGNWTSISVSSVVS